MHPKKLICKKLNLLFSLLLLSVIIFSSCQKTELTSNHITPSQSEIANKFFMLPVGTDPLVKHVVTEIAKRNNSKEFVSGFASKNGYPVWDKVQTVMVKRGSDITKNGQSNSLSNSLPVDTLLYIPVVLLNANTINGYILATINDSVHLNLYRAQDYKAYPYSETAGRMTASKYALQMMLLNKQVFGNLKYELSDTALFPNIKNRVLSFSGSRVPGNSLYEPCEEIEIWWNPDGDGCNCNGDEYFTGETYFIGDCGGGSGGGSGGTIYIGWFPPVGDTNIPPPPPPGGSGGGDPIPPVYPCNTNLPQSLLPGEPLPPCPAPGPGTGWVPLPYEIEIDESASSPGVDIKKLFKCFDNIPDFPAATYSITLCADVPVNNYPSETVALNANPGHTFVIITKTNGTQSVTQAFGFYPTNGKNSITTLGPVPSKIVDDKLHEINASITIPDLDPFYFNSIRANAENVYSLNQYHILNYNCSNFAIDLFNLAKPGNPIVVSPYLAKVFIGGTPLISIVDKAPQELFSTLKNMKNSISPDANNIIISQDHSYRAPVTNGECN